MAICAMDSSSIDKKVDHECFSNDNRIVQSTIIKEILQVDHDYVIIQDVLRSVIARYNFKPLC